MFSDWWFQAQTKHDQVYLKNIWIILKKTKNLQQMLNIASSNTNHRTNKHKASLKRTTSLSLASISSEVSFLLSGVFLKSMSQ